jgi:hypothetical protein
MVYPGPARSHAKPTRYRPIEFPGRNPRNLEHISKNGQSENPFYISAPYATFLRNKVIAAACARLNAMKPIIDGLVKSPKTALFVIPAKAGIL